MKGFSQWIDINRVSTDFRIAILNLTIDGLFALGNLFFRNSFEQTYDHLRVEFPWFFSDFVL